MYSPILRPFTGTTAATPATSQWCIDQTMLQAPSLMVPGRKPTSGEPVEVDRTHWAGRHCIACVLPNGTPNDLVRENRWAEGSSALSYPVSSKGRVADVATSHFSDVLTINNNAALDVSRFTLMTLCTHVNASAAIEAGVIYKWGGFGSASYRLSADIRAGYDIRIRASVHDGTTTAETAFSASDIGLRNNWKTIAATYDGATLATWVDGAIDQTKATTLTPATNSAPIILGSSDAASRSFAGQFAYWYIFDRAFSESEMRSLTDDPYQILTIPGG